MIINDLDGYYIVFDTKNWNTELDTLTNNSLLMINDSYDYIAISVRKGTKVHDILEKEMPLKGIERSCGAEVCYRVPKSEFEKEELV